MKNIDTKINQEPIQERNWKLYLSQPEDYNLGDSLLESAEDISEEVNGGGTSV